MIKKRIMLTTMLVSTSLILSACTTKLNNSSNIEILNESKIEQVNLDKYEFKTIDFDLGKEMLTFKNRNKKATPFYIRGTMSLPTNNNEKLKPILLVHGCHDNDNIKRFDTGFKYLTEALAKNGYLAISLDINSAYDWKYGDNGEYDKIPLMVDKYINLLKEENQGNSTQYSKYGIDLKDKIDFDNLSLMGHSTTGEIVFDIAQKQIEKNQKIASILSVAPTIGTGTIGFDIDVEEISILVPELDGDVISLDGIGIFNTAKKANKQNILSLTVLENANHNYFNSEVEINDAETLGTDLSKQLSREEQENFLTTFAVNYFNAALENNFDNTIYDSKIPTVTKINGYDVKTNLQTSNNASLNNINKIDEFKSKDIKLNVVRESLDINKDTTVGVNLPLGYLKTIDLLSSKWEKSNSKISFTPLEKDFSKFNNISINALVDPSDKLNTKNESQSIVVELIDNKGKQKQVEVSKESNIISYPNRGKLDSLDLGEGKKITFWDEETPFSNIRIPLTLYKDINLKEIKEVNILFDRSDKGSLIFESFKLD